MERNVILVTFNYRLQAFGFLSLDDPELGIPGDLISRNFRKSYNKSFLYEKATRGWKIKLLPSNGSETILNDSEVIAATSRYSGNLQVADVHIIT